MSLRARFFLAMLVVSACVAGAIVAFSTFATGVTLHQHPLDDPNAPLTGPMQTIAATLQARIRDGGVAALRLEPPSAAVRPDWNVAIVDNAGIVIAGTPAYLVGTRLTHRPPFAILSNDPAKGGGAFHSEIGLHLLREGPLVDGSGQQIATVTFFPSETGMGDLVAGAYQARLTRLFWLAALVALLASGIASAILAAYLLKPLGALQRASAGLSQGDLSVRVPVARASELRDLATTFNRMAARLERTERLRAEMTSDIAHELRTPLNNVHGQLEAIEAGLMVASPERIRSLKEELARLGTLVADLQQLSLSESGSLHLASEPIAPSELLASMISKCEGLASEKSVTVAIDCPDATPLVEADALNLRHVVLNLIANAIRHAPAGGRVTLGARALGEAVAFTVTDNGSGIPPEQLEDIFERFFRSDAARTRDDGGSGLGLAIAKRLVEANGGTIRAENILGGGARLTFTVPLYLE